MSKRLDSYEKRKPNFIEDSLLGCNIREVPRLLPGVLLAVSIVVLFVWVTDLINQALGFNGLISYILMAMIIGILVRNLFNISSIFTPGINFCLKKILRFGIIMMGIRLSIFDVLKIGAWGIPIIIVCVISALFITHYFGRFLKLSERLATLIAVGTSICGASAIVATAPCINAKEEEVTYAVANITVFGTIALIVYPFLSHWLFGGNTTMAGLFTGTAIHETAQVAASGLVYDQTFGATINPTTADVAMVAKLIRNVLMVIVIPMMTIIYAKRNGAEKSSSEKSYKKMLKLFPLFILGFLFMAIIRSIGDANIQGGNFAIGLWTKDGWSNITKVIGQWSGYVLATAMAGVGLGTSFKSMKGLGIKPFYVGLFAAVLVGVFAIIIVFLLGHYVTF